MKKFRKTTIKDKFDQWITEHHAALYRHALWMTGNQDVATEMVQEAYFQAWNAIKGLKDQEKVLPWLLTILRRAIYREQRCQYHHSETVRQLCALEFEHSEEDPYRLLLIYRALGSLSPDHREVMLLHCLHGFSYDEISRQLQVPKGTVMSRMSRARETLQQSELSTDDSQIIQLDKIRIGNKTGG